MVIEQSNGVYVMRVASMLTGMHPQTLRKYERAGLLEPSRYRTLRMYSKEDIDRLKKIRHLVDDLGLNIAGVKVALKVHDTVLKTSKQLESTGITEIHRMQLVRSLDEGLKDLDKLLGDNPLASAKDYTHSYAMVLSS
jgi:MerR family transcriptional regulator/heat shock protein HspR